MSKACNYSDAELKALLKGSEAERDEGLRCMFLDKKLERSVIGRITAQGGSVEDARNAYQDGFLIFNRHIVQGTFRGDSSPGTYFVSICTLHWLDSRRRAHQQKVRAVDDPVKMDRPAEGSFESSFEHEEIRQLARKTLDLVQGDCRDLLWWQANGLRLKEIAEKLNILEDSVKNKIFRCRERLRDRLNELPDFRQLVKKILEWL